MRVVPPRDKLRATGLDAAPGSEPFPLRSNRSVALDSWFGAFFL